MLCAACNALQTVHSPEMSQLLVLVPKPGINIKATGCVSSDPAQYKDRASRLLQSAVTSSICCNVSNVSQHVSGYTKSIHAVIIPRNA